MHGGNSEREVPVVANTDLEHRLEKNEEATADTGNCFPRGAISKASGMKQWLQQKGLTMLQARLRKFPLLGSAPRRRRWLLILLQWAQRLASIEETVQVTTLLASCAANSSVKCSNPKTKMTCISSTP